MDNTLRIDVRRSGLKRARAWPHSVTEFTLPDNSRDPNAHPGVRGIQ